MQPKMKGSIRGQASSHIVAAKAPKQPSCTVCNTPLDTLGGGNFICPKCKAPHRIATTQDGHASFKTNVVLA